MTTKFAYSTDGETYHGAFETTEAAQAAAQEALEDSWYHEPGDEAEYWVGEVCPATNFLQADKVGEDIAERLEEWLFDDIPDDDGPTIELDEAQHAQLGALVIQYVQAVGGFKRHGITKTVRHTHFVSA